MCIIAILLESIILQDIKTTTISNGTYATRRSAAITEALIHGASGACAGINKRIVSLSVGNLCSSYQRTNCHCPSPVNAPQMPFDWPLGRVVGIAGAKGAYVGNTCVKI